MNRATALFIAVLAVLVGGYLAWDGSGRPWIGAQDPAAGETAAPDEDAGEGSDNGAAAGSE